MYRCLSSTREAGFITLRLALTLTPGLCRLPGTASRSKASRPGGRVVDKVHKTLKSGKVVCGMGHSQPVSDEVEGLTQSGEGVLNPLLRLLEVVGAFVGGAVAGDVGGESPILEEATSLYEGAVVGVSGVHKRPEPGGEGFDQQIVFFLGGSVEGGQVDVRVGLAHCSLRIGGIIRGYADEVGSCLSPMIQHRKSKGAGVSDEPSWAGDSALYDGGGGMLGSEVEDLILELADGVLLVGGLFEQFVDSSPCQALGNIVCKAFFSEGLHDRER